MSKEAMKLALDALLMSDVCDDDCKCTRKLAIKALEEALAKQEQCEPVAEYIGNNPDELDLSKRIGLIHRLKFIPLRSKLYTTPQQRTWVGLDEEDDIDWEEGGSLRDLVEAVEAKLKEKNT